MGGSVLIALIDTTKERDVVRGSEWRNFKSVAKSLTKLAIAIISLEELKFGRSAKKVKKERKRLMCNLTYEINGTSSW